MEAPNGRLHRPPADRVRGTPPPARDALAPHAGGPPPAGGRAATPPDDPARAVVMEALRGLDDPFRLEGLAPLTALRVVQERAARQYRDGWCASGRALRDVLRAAVEPVAEVLPPQAAEMLRVLAAGGTAAEAARRCGAAPSALRKRATPQIEAALVRYLAHLEDSGPP